VGGNVEELRGAIELHRSEGQPQEMDSVDKQRAMLRSILDLEHVDVEEIMTHRKNVEMINVDGEAEQQVQEILNSPYTRIPVYKDEQDNIIGVINVKTLLREIHSVGGDLTKIEITNVMSEPWFVPESTSLSDQLQAFRDRREHFALVVDEYGSFMGIVTLEDILEEIVGEIEDETDEVVSGVRKQPNGSLLVEGMVTIRDLNREFEWNLPDEDYSTIAGLILHEAQAIPEPGQSFTFYGFRFDVVRKQRHQITLVRMMAPSKEEA
jgi:Mg2+/Co2+ transporter CorB